MSEDILEEAINCLRSEGWDNEADAVTELIAEVARLRSERAVWIAHYQENAQQDARIKEDEAQLKDIEEDGDSLTVAYMLGGKEKSDENKVLIAPALPARGDPVAGIFP